MTPERTLTTIEIKKLLTANVGKVLNFCSIDGQLYGKAEILSANEESATLQWIDCNLLQPEVLCFPKTFYELPDTWRYDELQVDDADEICEMSAEQIAETRAKSMQRDEWIFKIYDDVQEDVNIEMMKLAGDVLKLQRASAKRTGAVCDADTILEDIIADRETEVSGIGEEIIRIFLKTEDKRCFRELFEAMTGCSFREYLDRSKQVLTE